MAQVFPVFAGSTPVNRAFHGELTRNLPPFGSRSFEVRCDGLAGLSFQFPGIVKGHIMLRPVSSFQQDGGQSLSPPKDDPGTALKMHHGFVDDFHYPAHCGAEGALRAGLNFMSQDYLGLAAHPAVREAALAALGLYRPGTTVDHEISVPVRALEARVARFLGLPDALTFASGVEAIQAALHGLLRAKDDVIVDYGAQPAMFQAAQAARAHVHRCPAGSLEALERRLARLVRQPGRGRLFIAVPMVAALSSKIPDMVELLALARQYGASVIADVTHDLGAMGQGGGGVLEIQGAAGRADVVVGSFAKSFGAGGGFVAFHDPDLRPVLAGLLWRSPALSAVNACAIASAFDLIEGPEGRRRRRRLHGNALRLRNHLMADGLQVMGQASHLVPVGLPCATAMARSTLLQSAGPLVPLLRAPVVAAHAPRWRIQLTTVHSAADIDDLAELVLDVTRAFDRQPLPCRARQLTQG
jgi:glycine C-acetyltransferase